MTKATAPQQFKKKLSIKELFGTVNAAVVSKHGTDGSLHVMRVAGRADGILAGESNYGGWTALTGSFRGINPATGETVDAGKCFLPDVALNMLTGSIKQGNVVDFAFDIYANLDEKSPVGFSYGCAPLVKPQEDPLAAMLAQAAPLALEAPKKGGK